MPRIYLPTFEKIFPPRQAQHVRVLRLNRGEALTLFDGKGQLAQARLSKIDKKTVEVEITALQTAPRPETFPIHLAMSVIREMDWVMQKATELGVQEITPLISARTQGHPSDKKQAHWHEVMISAAEQSGCNFLPTLHPTLNFETFARQNPGALILDPTATRSLKDLPPDRKSATLLIGPEGGLTPQEILLAKEAGCIRVSLHEQILRAETAAIVATGIVQFYFS